MDEQKQIEEMVITAYPIYTTMEDSLRKKAIEYMNSYTVFERLYKAGYRNISKSAADCLVGEDTGLKIIDHYITENHELRAENKAIRKETAEKFAERAKVKLNEWLEDNEDLNGKIDFGIAMIELIGVKSLDGEIISESLIDEICKQITESK